MSIVALQRVTLAGLVADKRRVLFDLQGMGCLHVIAAKGSAADMSPLGPSKDATRALEFLLSCPMRRHQTQVARDFDPERVAARALEIQRRMADLRDERDFLEARIESLRQWGDFTFPPLAELAGERLWFYVVPHRQMAEIEERGLPWHVVHRDERFTYVVVISVNEPRTDAMPVPRVRTGAVPLHELEARFDEVTLAAEDLQAERESLTRWITLYARDIHRVEDRAQLERVETWTVDENPLFALEAWVPRDRAVELLNYAAAKGLFLEQRDPLPEEEPPTLLENPPRFEAGEALVTFYTTPGYRTWDPSPLVLVSFAVFFAIILSDFGYAALLTAILALLWRRLGASPQSRQFRVITAWLLAASLVWGVFVGSYFGWTPPADSWLGRLKFLEITDATSMMAISVTIGVVHLALACIMDARRRTLWTEALPSAGWSLVFVGGLAAAAGSAVEVGWLCTAGIGVAGAGLLAVFLFTGAGQRPVRRFLKGLAAVFGLSSAFGDALSYLRLFALGLASASLAVAFNGLAADVKANVAGPGLLFAGLILLVGHSLNLMLAIVSGVVHGLRLNVIEFFNWSLKEDGTSFRPFQRREAIPWTNSH